MSNPEFRHEENSSSQRLTLDLTGLTEEQRNNGSMLLGGSAAEHIGPEGDFELYEVETLVYNWGDASAKNVFNKLIQTFELEIDSNPHRQPFVPVARLGGRLWLQSLQEPDFTPQAAYGSRDGYIVIPYDSDNPTELTESAVSSSRPMGILGKVGDRYVSFETAIDIDDANPGLILQSNPADKASKTETYSREEAVTIIRSLIEQWDFDNKTDSENSRFAFHLGHWAVETFGNQRGEDGYFLTTKHTRDIPGEDLPEDIRDLIAYNHNDERYYLPGNFIEIKPAHIYTQNGPVIPRWEEISAKNTPQEQLEFARQNPDIIEGIVPASVDVFEQVSVAYGSNNNGKWGLEFVANKNSAEVLPYGDKGHTWGAVQFYERNRHEATKLAQILCQLTLLATQHTDNSRDITSEDVETLLNRVYNEQDISPEQAIPLAPGRLKPKPENFTRELFIRRLLGEDDSS